jgi:hypothetical protein
LKKGGLSGRPFSFWHPLSGTKACGNLRGAPARQRTVRETGVLSLHEGFGQLLCTKGLTAIGPLPAAIRNGMYGLKCGIKDHRVHYEKMQSYKGDRPQAKG